MRILWGASLWRSACASVFTAMNSTPIISARIIRFTALEPPPPTPMTLINAKCSASDRSGIRDLLRGCGGIDPSRAGLSDDSEPLPCPLAIFPQPAAKLSTLRQRAVDASPACAPDRRGSAREEAPQPVDDAAHAAREGRARWHSRWAPRPGGRRPTAAGRWASRRRDCESWSISPPTPCGAPIRTGMFSTSRASSAAPPSRAPPPVSTAPAGSIPAWPERFTSSAMSE